MARATQLTNFMVKPTVLAEAMTLTDSDSGKTYFLNAAGGFEITLPAPRGGVNFEFIVRTTPTSVGYSIRTKGNTEIIFGKVITPNVIQGADSSSDIVGSRRVIFSVPDSRVGDSIEMTSDGTYWYVLGYCSMFDAVIMESSSTSPSKSPSTSPSISPSTSPSISPSTSA